MKEVSFYGVLVSGPIALIIWFWGVAYFEKKGQGALALLRFFILGPAIGMLVGVMLASALGLSSGSSSSGEVNCYQNQFGTHCDR